MKNLLLLFCILLSFAIQAQQKSTRIGLVRTAEFYSEETGITTLATTQKKITVEFDSTVKDISARQDKLEQLFQAIKQLGADPSDLQNFNSQKELYQQLEADIEERKNAYEAALNEREIELIKPLVKDIVRVLEIYRKEKKYTVIMNADNLDKAGVLLGYDPEMDITADFILYYNAQKK
jgi:Skp family chaperone for outer membrane proteins